MLPPASGCTSPAMIDDKVDLPAPFSPSRANTSPGRMSTLTCDNTCTGP